MLKLFNTLSKKIEKFQPIKDKRVSIYSCGPTVYDYVHIGNLRTYLFNDILRRVLIYDGYKVKQVMNITDVGHLTDDADSGVDKLEKGAEREKKTVWDVAKFYEKEFLNDIRALNILMPDKLPHPTDHIKQQIKIIETLVKINFAYDAKEAVYFDVSKFPDYTKLSGQKLKDKKQAARTEVVKDLSKKNPADFALWFKLTGKFADHSMHWPSPWGEGFPGWHIECSAMSTEYLGQPFDIHTGGVDLIMPHHSNEIAQSQSASGKPLANYWLHGEHLLIKSGKPGHLDGEPRRMAKSENNFIRLKDIVDKGFSPLAFRYLVLGAHYQTKLNFSWESLRAAQNSLDHLLDLISELKGSPGKFMCADYAKAFDREINNNLDTARALSLTWRLLKKPNPDKLKISTIKKFDKVFGLDLLKGALIRKKIPNKIKELAKTRERLRKQKEFGKADDARAELEKLGYEINDTPEGPVVKKK
ncbi:MAG: cysteine--tRNA ligase [Candidatus Doudnabacteria bacterium CG10_big_fil_rev_8_21_14_0_10_41_10]|uniref:Cysteine--tRNA ligase n=1 Tax=Candidatus Doudnabacteria bacterium CG10_big_fil_rev_8_21_14_0_10_41_10 TaxID=1974551 RepID=A0A2H0VEY5_9BACT|nr:MAG: cysteine--tRNA ligase [Candidatus Doudnabacteria bacterium CG10_big_fil_rev_8_21_14_0_10_41_10]